MYLKSLVLKGFKSFADRSVLSMEPGITAIVGPNGSGKSNISDAVLWVLGERNAKSLRGQVMEDVIFAGSSARKSVGVAEVTLVLDNSDGSLPVDYDEVAVTRRMYRNGESDYLINNTLARRMDVLDILHDSGLGTGTHSIISQGHLDNILSSKPEDRRALIEEAAGVLKHKQRKAKSQRKLEQMDLHLMRVKDVVSEVERQLGPLQRKARRALQYAEASEQLKDIQLILAVDDLRALKCEWDETVEREKTAEASLAASKQEVDEAEAEYERLQAKIRKESTEVASLANKQTRVASLVERLESTNLLISERRKSAQTRCAELTLELDSNNERRKLLQGQRADAAKRLEEVREKRAEVDELLRQTTDKAQEAKQARIDLENELSTNSRTRNEIQRSIDDKRRELTQSQEKLAGALGRLQAAEGLDRDFQARVDAARGAQDVAEATLSQTQQRLTTLVAEEAKKRQAMEEARAIRDKLAADADEAQAKVRSLESTIKGLEEVEKTASTAASPARAWLLERKGDTTGALFPLSEELFVEEGYESIVERLLGADSLSLIAEDPRRVRAIDTLIRGSEQEGGVTLVLASEPQRLSVPSARNSKHGMPLIAKLSTSDAFAPIAEALLGDVVLCDTLDAALVAHAQDKEGLRFATPEGNVVFPNGRVRIVNESETDKDFGSFGRARRLVTLKDDLALATIAADEARRVAEKANEAARIATDECLEASQKLADAKGAVSSAKREQIAASSRLEKVVAEHKASQRSQAESHTLVETLRPVVESLNLQLNQLESDLSKARDVVRATQQKLDPARNVEARLSQTLSETKLKSVTLAQQETYELHIVEERANELIRIGEADEGSLRLLAQKQRARKRTEPLMDTLRVINDNAHRVLGALSASVDAAQTASIGASANATEARNVYRSAQESLTSKTNTLASIREEKVRLEMRVQSLAGDIVTEMGATMEEALETPVLDDRATLEEEAEHLRRRISNMGTINPDAAKEYEELKSRYDYLRAQLSDLASARATLKKIDAVIDERMRDDFSRTFDQVNGHFQQIFAQLFPGGSAILSLVDPNDLENTGVEVSAQPRGKKISKMSLMSGGEKSLVALALLFAVYKTRSTPFYILDEVEAALDDSNLRRLISYLDALREETQLIMITHQRRTMEMADVLFGVSMQADGVTRVISQRLEKALQYAE